MYDVGRRRDLRVKDDAVRERGEQVAVVGWGVPGGDVTARDDPELLRKRGARVAGWPGRWLRPVRHLVLDQERQQR